MHEVAMFFFFLFPAQNLKIIESLYLYDKIAKMWKNSTLRILSCFVGVILTYLFLKSNVSLS